MLTEASQGGVAVLVQVPAPSRTTHRGVLVQQGAGLSVGKPGQPGIRADITELTTVPGPDCGA